MRDINVNNEMEVKPMKVNVIGKIPRQENGIGVLSYAWRRTD